MASEPAVRQVTFAGERRKIMTYNVQNMYRAKNGRLLKHADSMRAVATAIFRENPDVIMLQEMGDRRFATEFNQDFLEGKYPHISVCDKGSNGKRTAIMAKAHMQVSAQKSYGEWDMLEARFRTPTGYEFQVLNMHLSSMQGKEDETLQNRLQGVKLAKWVVDKRIKQNEKAHILLGGDLNALPDSLNGNTVLDVLQKDSRPAHRFTEVMLKDNNPAPTWRGIADYPDAKLDYLFVSPELSAQVRKAYVAGKFRKYPWAIASDHRPLVVEIEEPDVMSKQAPAKKVSFGAIVGAIRRPLNYTA